MDKKEQILHYHRVDGLSLREIARRTGLNRKTVARYIREYEAKTEKTLRNLELRFERFDLVICDELGYVGFDKEGAEMLFNHLSLRTGKKATIITTNLPFTRWEEVLKDKVLCSALVDRLCHKSYLVNMTGASYRVKETKKIINKANV